MEIKNKFTLGTKVYFYEEPLPFYVKAFSDRYVIAVRRLNKRADAELLKHKVRMNAYCSFEEAYQANIDAPIYTILDLQEGIRGGSSLVFDPTNYFDTKDCKKLIKLLELGEVGISHRNRTEIQIVENI